MKRRSCIKQYFFFYSAEWVDTKQVQKCAHLWIMKNWKIIKSDNHVRIMEDCRTSEISDPVVHESRQAHQTLSLCTFWWKSSIKRVRVRKACSWGARCKCMETAHGWFCVRIVGARSERTEKVLECSAHVGPWKFCVVCRHRSVLYVLGRKSCIFSA